VLIVDERLASICAQLGAHAFARSGIEVVACARRAYAARARSDRPCRASGRDHASTSRCREDGWHHVPEEADALPADLVVVVSSAWRGGVLA
jgi:hypothetical protein